MPNSRADDETQRLRTEVGALKTALLEAERRIEVFEERERYLIPAEEVHRHLDQLNLPRRSPQGWKIVLSERFAILKMRLERESP